VIEKSKILVYRQKVSFLFCFVLAYSYLCNQVSARSLGGGAGVIFEGKIITALADYSVHLET
jgi:hypothetical protein